MKAKFLLAGALALSLGSVATFASAADGDSALYGDPIAPSTANHVIKISPDTQYVNVTGGDAVQFQIGNKSFGWDFDAANKTPSEIDMRQIAPSGSLNHSVKIYVDSNPLYAGS